MKTRLILIITIGLFLFGQQPIAAQSSKETTTTFTVSGVCALCKKRIEEAAKGKGIQSALWNIDTKMLTLVYNPARTSVEKVQERIAAVGHDNEGRKADDAVYKNLHECCLYRDLEASEGEVKENLSDSIHSSVRTSRNDALSTANNLSQTVVVTGVVLEEDKKGVFKPLYGASVVWLGTEKGTTTDSSGVFFIPPSTSTKRLVISYSGYEPDTITIVDNLEIRTILANGKALNEVRVIANRPATYISSLDPFRKAVITQKELLKAACCNLSESFETNPSVDVSFNDAVTGSKQIQLLGLSGNYTQLTVENLPGPRGLATPLGLNSIPGTWVESIQLIKGTGSVVNGYESIAGQINVELKKPPTSEQLYANIYTNDNGKTDLNLNLAKKLGSRWSTAILLHDAFAVRKMDVNKDGFRDFPTGNLFSGVNRWSYDDGRGVMLQFGAKYLKDQKTGGELDFNPKTDKWSTRVYGLELDIDRKEAFAKLGYVFPQKKYQSIGLQLSAFDHKQDSYFGLRTYNGSQKNIYSNLIYQSIIGNSNHKFKTGLSFQYDDYQEEFEAKDYGRKEIVPGGFFEYTFSPSAKLDIVGGLRGDHNSLYGFFATPRLNVRFEPVNGTTIRLSVGRGQRTANVFAENNSVLVSSRSVAILGAGTDNAYGLDPEVSWNKGISIDQKLRLFNRTATASMDFFRNDFQNQVVVDLEDPRTVRIYNLEGASFSNSFQTELSIQPVQNLDVRLAYRIFDVQTTYGKQLMEKPLTAKHRAFANLGYEIKGWKLDYTFSFNSKKRIPSTQANPEHYRLREWSPAYAVMNAQISKTVGSKTPIDLYLGGENLTNYFQPTTIVAADAPFSKYFDASQIWGPVSGRMIYAGIRFKIK